MDETIITETNNNNKMSYRPVTYFQKWYWLSTYFRFSVVLKSEKNC